MIVKYIRELLKDHDRVIIPNFGAFLKSKGEVKKIIFNEFIKFNDGQLINLISEKEGFPVSDASKRVDDFVEKTKKELSEKEKIEFEGIGYLYKDDNGRTRFTDYEQETIEADELAGAKAITEEESKPASETEENQGKPKTEADTSDEKAQKEEKKEKTGEPKTTEKKEEEIARPSAAEEKTPPSEKAEAKTQSQSKPEQSKETDTSTTTEKITQTDPRVRQEKPGKAGRKKMIIWLLVIFVPLIAIGAYVIIDYENIKSFLTAEKVETEQTTNDEQTSQPDTDDAEITPEEGEAAEQTDGQMAETQQEPEQTTPEEQPAEQEESEQQVRESEQAEETQPQETQYVPPKKYHLIAGVFSVKQNAEKKVKQLKEEGFYAEIVGRINDKYYVSYNSFDEKQDAAYEKDRLIEKGYETWIYYY